mgnify:CR=1 FL=1
MVTLMIRKFSDIYFLFAVVDFGIVNEDENEMDCFAVGGYAGSRLLRQGGNS